MTGRKERAKPREYTVKDFEEAHAILRPGAKMAPDIAAIIARFGMEVRVDFGKWGTRDTDPTLRVRLYDGSGGYRARVATAYGMSLSGALVDAYAQYLAVRRREQEAAPP